ncbi:ABC transporter permease [Actinokineospora auranticolor]|uniref:ABC-2 type transport system permease protein n=1 Tax=Actinokineospora auranticolor TaxID=155976 RepID=A0A2S6GZ20_9PSEU|nr:ABC transporter permease [Actinokineospora auranticolor]PPK70479.1 ABC-2 type transport system permease protein [Actinokineospora auranticolor]
MSPVRAVWLVARRELRTRLRTRSFLIGTAVSIAVLIGFVLMQSTLFGGERVTRVGLSGQATGIARALAEEAASRGLDVEVSTVRDPASGESSIVDGDLDALVTGAPASLHVVVDESLDENLRRALNTLVQREVLRAQLASVEDLDPDEVLSTVADATVDVRALRAPDPTHDQRLAMALVIVALLYLSLLLYGTMVAQGVVEEKSSRVVEILLATVRPWELLAGKVLGLGLVGLAQLVVVGGAGTVLAVVTGVLTIPSAAVGTLLWGLLWYLLGYLFYATVFAAAGSLVSRQEETQSVLLPITSVLVLAFVLSFGLLTRAPNTTATAVLSVLPPFAPILMPGRIALSVSTTWQVVVAILLMLGSTAVLTWLSGRIYTGAVLRTGPRLNFRQALRRP